MSEALLPTVPVDEGVTPPKPGTTRRPQVFLVGLAILVATGFLFVTSDLSASSPRIWCAVGIMVVCGIPIVAFAADNERRYALLPFLALGYMVAFGLPTFREYLPMLTGNDPLQEQHYTFACQMLLVGCIALVIGMTLPMGRWISGQFLEWPTDEKLSATRFGIASLLGGIAKVLLEGDYVNERVQLPLRIMSSMAEIGAFVVYALWTRKQASALSCICSIVGVACTLAVGFGSSRLWNVLQPLLIFFICYYALKRRVPWAALLITGALFVPANAAKFQFRSYVEEHQPTLLERPVVFAKIIWETYTEDTLNLEDAGETFGDRMDHVTLMAQVAALTPERVPYWGGETYKSLWYLLIPRLIMPDKPRQELGQEFGHRYFFLDEDDYVTSCNLPQIVETYANFGVPGIVIGMFLIGAFYASVSALFEQKAPPLTRTTVGAVVAMNLINIESDFSLVNGGFLWTFICLWVALRIMCWGHVSPAVEAS